MPGQRHHFLPARGNPGIRPIDETIRVFQEQCFPRRVERTAGRDVTVRKIGPQRRMASKRAIDDFRRLAHPCVRPEDTRLRIEREQLLYSLRIRMRMQPELLRGSDLDDAADHRRVRLDAIEMELADTAVDAPLQFLLDEIHRLRIAVPTSTFDRPGCEIAGLAIWTQFRNKALRIPLVQFDGAVIRRAGQESLTNSRLVENADDLLRRILLGGADAVVNVAIEQRQTGLRIRGNGQPDDSRQPAQFRKKSPSVEYSHRSPPPTHRRPHQISKEHDENTRQMETSSGTVRDRKSTRLNSSH